MLLLNLVGTVLLASAFEPQIPLHGDGGWWDSLKWAPALGAVQRFLHSLCSLGAGERQGHLELMIDFDMGQIQRAEPVNDKFEFIMLSKKFNSGMC